MEHRRLRWSGFAHQRRGVVECWQNISKLIKVFWSKRKKASDIFYSRTVLPFSECHIIGIMHYITFFSLADLRSIPGLETSLGEGKGYPLQHSGLENSMDCSPWIRRVGHDLATFTFTVYNLFQTSLLYLITFIQVSSISFCDFIAHFFLFLNNILLYWCTVVCLSIQLVKDILIASDLYACLCVWKGVWIKLL